MVTKIAELDDSGNVLLILVTDRSLDDVLGDLGNEDRRLVEWDGHLADEDAYKARWKDDGWTTSTAAYRSTVEQARAEALADFEAQQATAEGG